MHLSGLRASHILSLIAIAQVPSISAYPFDNQVVQADDTAPGSRFQPRQPQAEPIGPLPPVPWEIYTNPGEVWPPSATAYEINDGQVQVAYAVYTLAHPGPPTGGVPPEISTAAFTKWHPHHTGPGWWPSQSPPWTLPPGYSTTVVPSAQPTITSSGTSLTTESTVAITTSTSVLSDSQTETSLVSPIATSVSTISSFSTITVGGSNSSVGGVPTDSLPGNFSSSATPTSTTFSTSTFTDSTFTSLTSMVTSIVTVVKSSDISSVSASTSTVTFVSTQSAGGASTLTFTSLSTLVITTDVVSTETIVISPVRTSASTSSASVAASSSAIAISSSAASLSSSATSQSPSASSSSSASQVVSPIAATTTTNSHSTSTPSSHSTSTPSSSTSTMSVVSSSATITSVPNVSLTSLSTSEVQTATSSKTISTTGSVVTSLQTSLNPSVLPFPTSVANATSSLSLVDTATLSSVVPTISAPVTTLSVNNIFQTIAVGAPPPQISSRADHPVPRLGIQLQPERLETNKFYANFFLGSQSSGTWTHPYSVAWSKGVGQVNSWGLAISHIERSQLVGPGTKQAWDAGEWDYFQAPIGDQSLVISAAELGTGMTLTTDTLEAFSVNVNLVPSGAQDPVLTFPLVQGMGFVTGKYNSGTPVVQSGLGITNVTYVGATIKGTTYKYRAMLQNGFTWLIYVSPANASYNVNSFTLLSSGEIQGPSDFGGYIQIAKVPTGTSDAESVYDASAGAYATNATIAGSVKGSAGSYTLTWTKGGVMSQPLLMFALPHHVESFAPTTKGSVTDIQLVTTTKGMGTAVQADYWTLNEPDLPITMSFSPWSPELGAVDKVSVSAMEAINNAGFSELSQDIATQTNTGSLYYDGKALAKFAAIIYAVHDMADNRTLALTGLEMLESAFAFHVDNSMPNPLVYDTAWGGAVSISTYLTGNAGDDFGNTDYNDHHFHYGYFVYAAAVIGYLDPDWLDQGTNKAWVNMLVRDYANSITDDPYFPFSRMFDWYHGHSWAHGLIETADGKDQESSSEDTMASYGLKMWGRIIGDVNMEARGNLMLAVQARSLQHYYLYLNDNTVEPSEFIGNKVAGILFENKIQHVTYFGTNIEYIEGIHMLPLMPFSTLTRTKEFVQQEWDTYFADGALDPVSQVQGGWRGILLANHAIIDPVDSYNIFTNTSGEFPQAYLDGGASQTWYLAWSAALGGSPASS